MANTRTYSRSFAGGEISPSMYGRVDDTKFQTGAATVRNFITTPQGPAENRPGFAFVKATRNNGRAKLIPFSYSTTQTMVLEFGDQYIRFHTLGATLEYSATQRAFIPPHTVTFTSGTPCIVNWTGHTLVNGDKVQFYTHFPPPGTLPAEISADAVYTVVFINANSFNIKDSSGNLVNTAGSGSGTLYGRFYYQIGDLASFGGNIYYCNVLAGGINAAPTFPDWYLLPADLTYEIPSPYAVADVFGIHYVQSEDVLTLVHPSYAPRELRRLGATDWTLTPINFGTTIDAPTGVTATASPGFLAKITGVTLANPAVITTATSHTLALGDGIYIDGLIATIGGSPVDLSGFYLVNLVPVDGSGNLIPNELQVMDYDGNILDSSGWSAWTGPATIQYGPKIFSLTNEYAVSAIAQNGVDQSLLSGSASALCNLNVTGSYNTITWIAVPGALRYYVYKKKNGLWGYIGEATGTSFVDNNIAPDMSITPPNLDSVFGGSNDYPGAVSYFEQRRVFAGSNNAPQNVWATNSGTESDFTYTLPTRDSDRLSFRIASREANTIRHIVPLNQLVLLTSAAEFRVGQLDVPLTPSTVSARPQAYIGASNVQPSNINNVLVYCAARGGHVRELGFSWQADGYITGDLSLRAIHLFDNMTLLDQTFGKSPRPVVWFVSSSGKLLGLTYVPEEQIGAWHQHDTDGTFESITCVAEGDEDRLYAVIKRSVSGSDVRYVERMGTRLITTLEDCFFVDSGATFVSGGLPVTTISGLTWLEGKTVAILADGKVQNRKVVTAGEITLDYPAVKVQVGIPYQSDLQTLPLTLQIDGYGQGRQKNINKCWVRVYQSSSLFIGPSLDLLVEAKQRTTEPYGTPPVLQSSEIEVTTLPAWQEDGEIYIRQDNPLPLTVVGLTMQVSIGG